MQKHSGNAFDLEAGVAFAEEGALTSPATLRKRKASEDDFRKRVRKL